MKITGKVVPGKREAHAIGYPTANIEYASSSGPEHGVWTCYVQIQDREYKALAIIGMWNSKNGLPSFEVYILDFNADIYGTTICVELIEKLRDLIKFENVPALIVQIQKDIEEAEKRF